MKQIPLVIAVTLSIAACSKEQPKKIEIRPVRVTSVQHALSGDTISLTGQIQAKDQINLAFRIGGRLQERNVTVGDPVTPGQIVARIEPQDFQNALRSAEADLASAQAVLANAQATEGRQSELLSKGFATRVQYDQAEQVLKTAQSQVESAQAKLQNALDNPPDAMRLGATIVGQVKVQSEPVIQLPGTALTQSEGKPAVWVVDPEKKTVSLVPVTVGHYDTSSAVVAQGLKDGDLVVTAGVQALRPGQEVRLLETGAGAQK